MDKHDNEKVQGLDKYKDNSNRYVFLLFSLQKE